MRALVPAPVTPRLRVPRSARSPAVDLAQASIGGAILSAIPDFVLAGVCLFTWLRPMAIDPLLVKRLTALTLLEFIVVHSAPFTGIVALSEMKTLRKTAALVGLGAFYMLFAWGFAAAFDSRWPMIAFFSLMLNRLLPVLLGVVPGETMKSYVVSCWVVGAIAFLGTVFAAAALPIPPLGITADVIAAQGFTTGGLWPEQPYRPLFMGMLYFTIVGVWEIVGMRVVMRRAQRAGA